MTTKTAMGIGLFTVGTAVCLSSCYQGCKNFLDYSKMAQEVIYQDSSDQQLTLQRDLSLERSALWSGLAAIAVGAATIGDKMRNLKK